MSEFKDVILQSRVILGCTVLAALATSIAVWVQRKQNVKIPQKWKPVGKISKLAIYPLKSGAAVDLKEGECMRSGLKQINTNGKFPFLDRCFIVFDQETGNFVNAKKNKNLMKINVTGGNGTAIFTAAGAGEIEFKIPDENGKKSVCIMNLDEKHEVLDCGDEVSAWLAKVLQNEKFSWRLGYYLPDVVAKRLPKKEVWEKRTSVYNKLRKDDMGAYSDVGSYMIFSEESLKELNGRLEVDNQVTERNFRPNIVVSSTDKPFSEDSWDWIKIGDSVVMRRVMNCTRCVYVTIDPDSLITHPKTEPLKTLRSYRQCTDPTEKKLEGTSPVFGQYFGIHELGPIAVGDILYAGFD